MSLAVMAVPLTVTMATCHEPVRKLRQLPLRLRLRL